MASTTSTQPFKLSASTIAPFNVSEIRKQFPALSEPQVFFDNAGGSQVLETVIKSISDYLSHTNVQLGATYKTGKLSTNFYTEGCAAAAKYMNAEPSEVVIGPSTTQLFRNLSTSLDFKPGDELILCKFNHETNTAPWVSIAEHLGLTVKWWSVEKTANPQLEPDDLKKLLTEKTKLVAIPHASNILGTLHDVKGIADVVHSVPGAMICVDGVAYAPHGRIDVKELGVDFYGFSWYKVYGPHCAILYASTEAQNHLKSLGHFFNPTTTLENKIVLGGTSYELAQALPNIVSYLSHIFPQSEPHEEVIQSVLLGYLHTRGDVTVYGEPSGARAKRVPTISFNVEGWDPKALVEKSEEVQRQDGDKVEYGFRWGHFYAKRLCDEILGCGENGVVRVSMVHYNTTEEVMGLCALLDRVLGKGKGGGS